MHDTEHVQISQAGELVYVLYYPFRFDILDKPDCLMLVFM